MINRVFLVALLFANPATAQQETDCNNPVTQLEMNSCAWQAYQAADGDLNFDYKRAMDYLKKIDAEYLSEGAVPGAIMLRDAQRAWNPFRDKNCEVATLTFRGGSIVPLIRAVCLEDMTRARSEELRMIWEEN